MFQKSIIFSVLLLGVINIASAKNPLIPPAGCLVAEDGVYLVNEGSIGNDAFIGCLGHATTSRLNYMMSTSTTGSGGLLTSFTNQLLEGVFVFIRFILPYAVVIGLLMVGLGIAWRVFRGVGKV